MLTRGASGMGASSPRFCPPWALPSCCDPATPSAGREDWSSPRRHGCDRWDVRVGVIVCGLSPTAGVAASQWLRCFSSPSCRAHSPASSPWARPPASNPRHYATDVRSPSGSPRLLAGGGFWRAPSQSGRPASGRAAWARPSCTALLGARHLPPQCAPEPRARRSWGWDSPGQRLPGVRSLFADSRRRRWAAPSGQPRLFGCSSCGWHRPAPWARPAWPLRPGPARQPDDRGAARRDRCRARSRACGRGTEPRSVGMCSRRVVRRAALGPALPWHETASRFQPAQGRGRLLGGTVGAFVDPGGSGSGRGVAPGRPARR